MGRNNRRAALPVVHAHPLVVDLYRAMREHDMPVHVLAEKAGVSEDTIRAWFRKAVSPQIGLLEPALNVVGLKLTTEPIQEDV